MAKQIETKKDEVKFTTSDPQKMLNMYLSKRVLKPWVEDFVDEDSGEVVSIERNEVLFDAGKLIDHDLLTQIIFYIEAGDVKEVEVSNQKRDAYLTTDNGLYPYMVSASICGKSKKFLLYASSVMMAFDIANDYIELNYSGGFNISQVKSFSSCVIIEESKLKRLVDTPMGIKTIEEEQLPVIKEYYKVETNIKLAEDREYTQTFIVIAKDVDDAKDIINDWLKQEFDKKAAEKNEPAPDFSTTLKSATIFSLHCTIEKEFSMAYMDTPADE